MHVPTHAVPTPAPALDAAPCPGGSGGGSGAVNDSDFEAGAYVPSLMAAPVKHVPQSNPEVVVIVEDEEREIRYHIQASYEGHRGCRQSHDDPGEAPFVELDFCYLVAISVQINGEWLNLDVPKGKQQDNGESLIEWEWIDEQVQQACLADWMASL